MIEKIKGPLDLKVGNYKGTEFDIIPAETFAMVCRKINELCDVVNGILAAQEQYATIYNEDIVPMLMPENKEPAENVLTKSLRMDKEFAEAECVRLQNELERTRKALEIAVDALKLMYQGNGDPQDIMRYIDNRWTPVRRLCKQTLDEITALEQKDKL